MELFMFMHIHAMGMPQPFNGNTTAFQCQLFESTRRKVLLHLNNSPTYANQLQELKITLNGLAV